VQRLSNEAFGFFEFAPSERMDLELVERLILAAWDEVDRVDVVLLPECAVEEAEVPVLEALLDRWSDYGRCRCAATIGPNRDGSPGIGRILASTQDLKRPPLCWTQPASHGFISVRTNTIAGRSTSDRFCSTTWEGRFTLAFVGGRRRKFLVGPVQLAALGDQITFVSLVCRGDTLSRSDGRLRSAARRTAAELSLDGSLCQCRPWLSRSHPDILWDGATVSTSRTGFMPSDPAV
jgi:hypothetical protein